VLERLIKCAASWRLHSQLTQRGSIGRLTKNVSKDRKYYAGALLTGIVHQLNTMAHRTHFVQRGLTVEQNKTRKGKSSSKSIPDLNSLSVLKVSLNNPPILKESIGTFVIPKVYSFTCISNLIFSTGVSREPILY
jgi:hypothetical protein